MKTCPCGRMSICGFDCETEEPKAESSKEQDVSDYVETTKIKTRLEK